MKKHLLTLAISCLAAASLRADIVFLENFPYSNGTINVTGTNANGTTNWFLHSGSSDAFVKNHKLEIASTSATAGFQNRSGDVHRNFTTQTNTQTILYSSFTVNCTNVPPAAPSTYFAHFYVSSTTFHGRLFAMAGSLPNTWRLGIAGAAGTPSQIFAVDLATNTDYQVVTRWNPTTDNTLNDSFSASLWVNPLSFDDPHVISSDAVTAPAASSGYAFRQASGFGNGFMTVSNLAVATTFDEATTNVWSTNAVSPLVIYDLKGGTNFPGENINLSTVFAGQGLGTVTYQWLKDGVGIVNPNGNSNVFGITGAQAPDSGNYQVIATTAYSLSATSATVFLWVTNAPIAPIITQQPATNTTVFFHQNVTLHISALGPLPLTYQWFRNNAPLSDGPNFSGSTTDTLLITDVLTNNGTTGTYRCDATSPYGTTPSVNAAVNAVAPPANSIAFLRTLVDANFVATNSALRWQATGVVSTFTNLTTGDTSSYYMQDSTRCGINIFVTHGSNFRPNQGDVVTFVGWLSSFNSTLELEADTNDTTTSFTVLSNNVSLLPSPKPIPFSITNNLAFCETNLEGSLVMLTNVYFGTNAGLAITTNANMFITVTNAAGETFTILFSSQDLDTAGQTLPDFAYTVVGVFNQNLGNAVTPRNSAYQVEVTRYADIVTNPLVISSSLLSSGTNTLSWDAAPYSYSYTIYSASNVSGPYLPLRTNLHFTNTFGSYSESVSAVSQKFLRLATP